MPPPIDLVTMPWNAKRFCHKLLFFYVELMNLFRHRKHQKQNKRASVPSHTTCYCWWSHYNNNDSTTTLFYRHWRSLLIFLSKVGFQHGFIIWKKWQNGAIDYPYLGEYWSILHWLFSLGLWVMLLVLLLSRGVKSVILSFISSICENSEMVDHMKRWYCYFYFWKNRVGRSHYPKVQLGVVWYHSTLSSSFI